MRYEDDNLYIDFVFYRNILKWWALINLKLERLIHSDVGQMDSYIRMFDDLYKNYDDSIGLILCFEKNEVIAKHFVLNDKTNLFTIIVLDELVEKGD